MQPIGNMLPSAEALFSSGARHGILDLVFRDNALVMNYSHLLLPGGELLNTIAGGGVPTPLPIIGFSFEHPSQLNFLKYQYSEYPFLDRAMVANSFVKDVGGVQVRGLRPITRGNPVILNYTMNKLLIKLIERYADQGGTWTLNTMWGPVSNLVLESLDGVKEDNATGGVAFDFTFRRICFSDTRGVLGKASSLIGKFLA